jgi:hypothetical protein
MASSEGQLEVVQRLLAGGADARADVQNMTAAKIAEESGHEEVADVLRQALDGGGGGGNGGEDQRLRLAQRLAKAAVSE